MNQINNNTVGQLVGWVIFLIAATGLFFLLKGRGRHKYIGTWNDLARHYAVDKIPLGYQITSGMIGWERYEKSLQISVTPEGVYLLPSVQVIKKKPLLIPYDNFSFDPENAFVSWGIRKYVHFTVEQVDVSLGEQEANQILLKMGKLPVTNMN